MKGNGTVLAILAVAAGGGPAHAEDIVPFEVVGQAIPRSLTDKPGDPAAGRRLVTGLRTGNCLACHRMPIPEEPFHGTIGPDLAGVGRRLSEGELRLRIVDAKRANPDTPMPAMYRTDGLTRVARDFVGKPVLTAEQVEDVVAYLLSLKE